MKAGKQHCNSQKIAVIDEHVENPKLLFAYCRDTKFFELTVICKKQSKPKQTKASQDLWWQPDSEPFQGASSLSALRQSYYLSKLLHSLPVDHSKMFTSLKCLCCCRQLLWISWDFFHKASFLLFLSSGWGEGVILLHVCKLQLRESIVLSNIYQTLRLH